MPSDFPGYAGLTGLSNHSLREKHLSVFSNKDLPELRAELLSLSPIEPNFISTFSLPPCMPGLKEMLNFIATYQSSLTTHCGKKGTSFLLELLEQIKQ